MIVEGLSYSDSCLFNLIPDSTKVLMIKPSSYRNLRYLVDKKGIDLFVMDINQKMAVQAESSGATFFYGDLDTSTINLDTENFDMIVMDEILPSYYQPDLILKYTSLVAKTCLITIKNKATIGARIRFLLSGRMIDTDYDKKWFSEPPSRTCSMQEFLELATICGCTINRACFYDKNSEVRSLYDLMRSPSLTSNKFYFITVKEEELITL